MTFTEQFIPGNPYALIKNGVCVGTVAMQDYDNETIAATLDKYIYDEIVVCREIGYNIYAGQTLQEGVWAYLPVYKSWVLNKKTRWWESPKPYPKDDGVSKYRWSEEKLDWVKCTNCIEENNYSYFGLSASNSGVPVDNEEINYLIYTAAMKENINAN